MRMTLAAAAAAALMLSLSPARAAAQSVAPDSIYVRAQRLVSDGDAATGRALVDSMLRSSRRGSPAYAEALFWHAALAPNAHISEQDYRRLIVEYPLYARSGDVLLRLAQLELFRGNRDAAIVHLKRIQTEHPEFGEQAAASYWLAKALLEKNDQSGACSALGDAKRLVKSEDVELKNQVDYLDQECAGVSTNPTRDTSSISKASPPSPSTAPSPAPVPPSVETKVGSVYSVQVAAYAKSSQAKSLAAKLTKRGFAARVDGGSAPFRVRVGKYSTRTDAAAAQERMKKSGISGIVIKAN
jgi:cell division septation protein DedD